MLQSINDLHNFTLHAKDGEIGTVEDLYFDDARWIIRYLVIATGNWLSGRRVFISPASVQGVDWSGRTIPVALTCDQVKNSPSTDTDRPVSRQHEEELIAYYGWPSYWTLDPFLYEPLGMPIALQEQLKTPPANKTQGDPHLRSAHEVKGYHIEAEDGSIGHVVDFVFDDATWAITFMVVDAGTWLHKRLVLLKPEWIQSMGWEERRVAVDLSREAVKASPEFLPVFPIPAEYAERLSKHYRGTS